MQLCYNIFVQCIQYIQRRRQKILFNVPLNNSYSLKLSDNYKIKPIIMPFRAIQHSPYKFCSKENQFLNSVTEANSQ